MVKGHDKRAGTMYPPLSGRGEFQATAISTRTFALAGKEL